MLPSLSIVINEEVPLSFMLTPGYQHTYSENKNNNILARKNTIFVIFGFERLKFLPNDDRSIDNGFALQLCLGISLTQEHETATKRKSNVHFTRQSSLFRQLFVK